MPFGRLSLLLDLDEQESHPVLEKLHDAAIYYILGYRHKTDVR